MLDVVRRILAAIFGFFAYSIYTTLLNAAYLSLLSIGFILISPFVGSVVLALGVEGIGLKIAFGVVGFGLGALVGVFIPVVLGVASIVDVFKTMALGIVEGWRNGAVFVSKRIVNEPPFVSLFADSENGYLSSFHSVSAALFDLDGRAQHPTADFSSFRLDDLEIPPKLMLSDEELANANLAKTNDTALAELLRDYEDLNTELQKTETFMMDIEEPILLVKQYQSQGQWHSLAAHTYKTCQQHMSEWVQTNATNPFNRDPLANPGEELVNGQQVECRYRWYPYDEETGCSYQNELVQQIKDRLSANQSLTDGIEVQPQVVSLR